MRPKIKLLQSLSLVLRATGLVISVVLCYPLTMVVPELAIHMWGRAKELERELEGIKEERSRAKRMQT